MQLAEIRALPKILLHDHLDGGLRPQTVIDLAAECGYDQLPTRDAGELGQWFVDAADSGSLVRYLEGFEHTVAVMQTEEAIRRVAAECVEDLVADGVVYAEVRFAPELFTAGGLSMGQAVEAVLDGFDTDLDIEVNALLCAMRQADRGSEVADLVIAFRDDGVAGMDIAGPEVGFPASLFAEPFATLRRAMCHYTIHAGEAAGVESIRDALAVCSAERLGHGVRIIEDIRVSGEAAEIGEVAQYVRDREIPLEVCPSSNLQTGIADSIAEHPVTLLNDLGFTITLNTDNRLMSGTSLSQEMHSLVEEAGWDLQDLYGATIAAVDASFQSFDDKADLIVDVIQPGWSAHID
ncbi:MAG: adenosine deaminase [Micrococcales bacterium]|nr:adenosine deaminase [Micrococcales bacterium]